MNRSSVLTKRAALFTAIVMTVTVAVSLCAYAIGAWIQTGAALRERLIPQAGYLSGLAGDEDKLTAAAEVIATSGGAVWRVAGGDATAVAGDVEATFEKRPPIVMRSGSRLYVVACADIDEAAYIAVASPAGRMFPAVITGLVAALIGALFGVLIGRLTRARILRPAERPLEQLRDAAVAMAEGHLETRADERFEGVPGELGKALNHLSDQLSRNMYTLIVERNRLRNMLNGLSEGIVAINAEGRVTHTNPALGKLIPRAKSGTHFSDPRMKTIPDATIWEDFDKVMSTGEPMTRNLEVSDMTLRMTVTPIVDEIDAIAGAVGLFSDITQMERLERTRRDYVSNVSHELRTPLTAMRALIEPLKEGMVTAEADRMRYYDIILREIMRLSRLINDQLELSRLQSGTLSIRKTKMKIDDLVYDVCDRYAAIAEEHGLKLKVITDFTQCPSVYANADRLEQMLIILLDNAIKYTEQGSVSLSARWDDEKVVLSVKDTGIGIAEQDLPYVFDRFYKVDKAHSGKGSGLGLSIAKELLKRMGEDIRVASEKGKGTQFSFTVHREPPVGDEAEKTA